MPCTKRARLSNGMSPGVHPPRRGVARGTARSPKCGTCFRQAWLWAVDSLTHRCWSVFQALTHRTDSNGIRSQRKRRPAVRQNQHIGVRSCHMDTYGLTGRASAVCMASWHFTQQTVRRTLPRHRPGKRSVKGVNQVGFVSVDRSSSPLSVPSSYPS
jgi:hypothetical protein